MKTELIRHFGNLNKPVSLKEEKNLLDNGMYNCWGFTAYMKGWEKELKWLSDRKMNNHLDIHTKQIKFPRVGDIAVFRNEWEALTHTAIISEINEKSGRHKTLHKDGCRELAVEYLKDVKEGRYSNSKITYWRVVK